MIRQEPYVFNDGMRKELVNLCGTIPVVYKSKYFKKNKSS